VHTLRERRPGYPASAIRKRQHETERPGLFMIAIILSTCLVSHPAVCREQTIPLSSEVSAIQCTKFAALHVAQWSEQHPRWRVVRWRCQLGRQHDI
jgi:hypothetical protein